jgi:Tfp pilus assembly protein PilV
MRLRRDCQRGRRSPARGRPEAAAGARGFTLIEVLVALVVLMLGIYGMLRIFPRGFSAIEVSQQRTTAAQLAEAEIARWKLHPESLPDAVVATDYQHNLIEATLRNDENTLEGLLVYGEAAARMPGTTSFTTVTLSRENLGFLNQLARPLIYSPLDLTPSQFDAALGYQAPGTATLHPNWQPNSLYLPRTIIGERIDVRRLGRTALGVPFYLLSHAPLDVLWLEGEDRPGTREDDRRKVYVDVYDAKPWRYVPGAPAVTLRAHEFSVDVSTGTLHLGPTDDPSSEEREFRVDYTDPLTFQRTLGLRVIVGPGATAGTPPLPAGVDAEIVQVNERLQEVDDRSLLLVADETARRNIYYVNPETTISGRIEFPLALQIAPRPTDITLVKVDYRVFDWGILTFDVEVPPEGVVRLPVTHLKGPAYANPPRQFRSQEVARGIRRYYDWAGNDDGRSALDPTTWAYVVAVDLQSGEEILTDHEGAEWPPNPYERKRRFLVDYTAGILDFNYEPWEVYSFSPTVDTPDRSNRTYRVFCRGQSDWAVQLMVAARRYGRSGTGVPGGQPVAPEGGMTGSLVTYAWRPGVDARQVYFPLSEAGQTVAIDYYYLQPDTGELTFVEGEVHTVSQANVTDLGQWVCRLEERLAWQPYQWGPVGVRGISVRARAAWVGPGSTATLQDLAWALNQVPTARAPRTLREVWHQVMVTTYLTRAPI